MIEFKRLKIYYKETAEFFYWSIKHKLENILSNEHYKKYFTSHFGLDESFYYNKTVLDIGCGPRGSLEWAKQAKYRIGLDPLSSQYRKFGTNQHEMNYITSYSENLPLKDGKCDVVCSFNSLDHVYDVNQTIREIKRITSLGGLLLLIVEVNHKPRICEPHQFNPNELIDLLKPEFSIKNLNVYKPVSKSIYKSIRIDEKYENPEIVTEKGYLSASFIRIKAS